MINGSTVCLHPGLPQAIGSRIIGRMKRMNLRPVTLCSGITRGLTILLFSSLSLSLVLIGCSAPGPSSVAVEPPAALPTATTTITTADLSAIKQYTLDNARQMKTATAELLVAAEGYYDFIAEHNFDYNAAWAQDPATLRHYANSARTAWINASRYYELDEGIIAGVPSLAFYDVWIDAGPSGLDNPVEAYDWTLELPDGRVLDRPGNFFHSLLEPALWGTWPHHPPC